MAQDFDVLLLAAGFGTRLRPLTESTPKALVEIGGTPLIVRHLNALSAFGVKRVIVNLHYLGSKIKGVLGSGGAFGMEIVYSEEDPILDTGGAIAQIASLLHHDYLLTINADTVLGAPFFFKELLTHHRAAPMGTLFTAVVREDPEQEKFGTVTIDPRGEVLQFLGAGTVSNLETRKRMFTGVEVLSREALKIMPPAGSVFSVTRDIWVRALSGGYRIQTIEWKGYWNDVGNLERLTRAEADLRSGIYK